MCVCGCILVLAANCVSDCTHFCFLFVCVCLCCALVCVCPFGCCSHVGPTQNLFERVIGDKVSEKNRMVATFRFYCSDFRDFDSLAIALFHSYGAKYGYWIHIQYMIRILRVYSILFDFLFAIHIDCVLHMDGGIYIGPTKVSDNILH